MNAAPVRLHAGAVTHLDEMAETIRDDALAQARRTIHPLLRRRETAALLVRPDFFGHFKHGLARNVALTLAAADSHLHVVFAFEPSINPAGGANAGRPPDLALHLLALVAKPSETLDPFAAALNRALTDSLKELPAPPFARLTSALEVIVITGKDVRLGLGYAGMLSSVYVPPLKVWEKEE